MTDSGVALQKAVMIPIDDDDNPQFDQAIAVQFNPESLKVSQSNTLSTGNAGGDQTNAAQFVDKSESSLAVQLIFDTSIGRPEETITFDAGAVDRSDARNGQTIEASHEANSDVRVLTKAIAELFMKPGDATADGVKAPRKCRFQWGAFAFVGMMSSYEETLDFFAPEGIPLRATLALGFKEDRFQFENLPGAAAARDNPTFTPGGDNVPVAKAANNAGAKPRNWRDLALFNGVEAPRFAGASGLSVPGTNDLVGLASSGGGTSGLASTLGVELPGAFDPLGRFAGDLAETTRFASANAMAASAIVSTTIEAADADGGRLASLTAAFDEDTA